MKNPKPLKVALVCDWLTGTGGAERVVLELHRMFPEAPIYTSQYDRNSKIWYGDEWFKDADVRTGWLQKLPKSLKKFLPVLRAWYFSRLNLDGYDLVISSSGAEAKFINVGRSRHLVNSRRSTVDGSKKNTGDWGLGTRDSNVKKPLHICYCHSPTHYYWARYDEYMAKPGFGLLDPLARLGLMLLSGPMRRWDHHAAQKPDYFIANSTHTKNQIKQYYGRDAKVIFPPVDVERFISHSQPAEKRHGLVTAGRQTPYKRIDLPVEAITDEALVVIGNGPDHSKLERLAGRNVTFLTNATDHRIAEVFGGSRGFIMPNADDFGIVAAEALAAGTPVIAFRGGGALDYINRQTGVFFDKQNVSSLKKSIANFNSRKFDHAKIQASAQQFSAKTFRTDISRFIPKVLPRNGN